MWYISDDPCVIWNQFFYLIIKMLIGWAVGNPWARNYTHNLHDWVTHGQNIVSIPFPCVSDTGYQNPCLKLPSLDQNCIIGWKHLWKFWLMISSKYDKFGEFALIWLIIPYHATSSSSNNSAACLHFFLQQSVHNSVHSYPRHINSCSDWLTLAS